MTDIYRKYRSCEGRVTTDSRAVKGGEMFIALKGDNFDGNAFALKALEAGARYAVVSADSEVASSGRKGIITVADTFETLKALALEHRRTLRIPVLGLTGTNGKTTTKELVRAVLSSCYRVAATSGNLNNDIGVPLTVLSIPPDAQIAIVEMGASHPGDIKHLVDVCEPEYGLITNVGKAHLLGFGSFEGVKKTKGELYDFIAGREGKVFVNADDADLVEMARSRDALTIIPYGLGFNHAKVLPSLSGLPFLRIRIGHRIVKTHLVGAYNATNVLAAIAVGLHFDIPLEISSKAIASYVPSNNRSQMVATSLNTVIVDAYNANPSSMSAALDNFALVEADRKVALLGDMRELGEDSLKEHVGILRKALSIGCEVLTVGEEFARAIACEGSDVASFATSLDLADTLRSHPIKGAVVLVKGSRGIKMETVIPEL